VPSRATRSVVRDGLKPTRLRKGFVPARREPEASGGVPEAAVDAKTERSEGLAEREGFEPPCPLRDKTLSRRPRYDHFGTSPH
jgi:hypothetical protein